MLKIWPEKKCGHGYGYLFCKVLGSHFPQHLLKYAQQCTLAFVIKPSFDERLCYTPKDLGGCWIIHGLKRRNNASGQVRFCSGGVKVQIHGLRSRTLFSFVDRIIYTHALLRGETHWEKTAPVSNNLQGFCSNTSLIVKRKCGMQKKQQENVRF